MIDTDLARFESKYQPEPNSGCWLWDGTWSRGYGQFRLNRKLVPAHRASYEHYRGPIPPGLPLDHLCRVRCCVNPDHLEIVTCRENTLRSPIAFPALNARRTHCPQGHPYDAINTYIWPNGKRGCRICRCNAKRYRDKHKQ